MPISFGLLVLAALGAYVFFSAQALASETPMVRAAGTFVGDPNLCDLVASASSACGLDPLAALAVIHQEGSFNPGTYGAPQGQYPSGDGGHSHGPMQVDDKYHAISGDPSTWDQVGNADVINVGCQFLAQCVAAAGGVCPEAFHRYNGLGGALSSYGQPAYDFYLMLKNANGAIA